MKNPEIVGAVLVGSAVIATGLYLGLRSNAAPAPAAPTMAAPQSKVAPPAADPEPGAGAPAPMGMALPGVPAEQQARVQKDTARAIEAAKPGIVRECWGPSAARAAEPSKIKLKWNGTIGSDGRPAASGLSEDREASRPDLTDCVLAKLSSLHVPPPPTPTFVSIELTLP